MPLEIAASRATHGQKSAAVVSAEEAAAEVRDGDHIVISGCGAAPLDFLAALAERRDHAEATISHATAWGALPHLTGNAAPPGLRFEAYFLPAVARGMYRARQVDYVPLTFSQMGAMYRAGELKTDVVAVTCSIPDESGYCSLGPFVSYLPAAIEQARVVIGECSPAWPRTSGAARIHSSTFDFFVKVDRGPVLAPPDPDQPEAVSIARHVASLVPDGATIQIGRGAIPNAVARELSGHRDLGVHSEMLSDWIVDLAESSVVTGSRKRSEPGCIVTSFMDGSARLYRFVDGNPSLKMRAIYDVNDPAAVAREPNFIAINSAVEIDLTGQVNAESVDGQLISGSGGLLDFAIGAARAPGGKFIVALPSTAKGGAISRIAAAFGAKTAVTVPRTLAQYVVTEHGIAELRGCTLEERARRLIRVAAPAFREELARQAGARP